MDRRFGSDTHLGMARWKDAAPLALVLGALVACNSQAGPGFGEEDGAGGEAGESNEAEAPSGLECGKLAPPETVVLGYVPTYRNVSGLTESLDFSRLTHVAVAFGVPVGEELVFENQIEDATIRAFLAKARDSGVRTLISIGGAAGSVTVHPYLAEDRVDGFVEAIVRFVDEYGFDGVDVDIESSHVDATYGPFVQKLAARIRPLGKLVTSAVAENFAPRIDDRTLWCFDFINIMSYDYKGTWSAPGDHASFAEAQNDIGYWTDTRGYARARTVLGLPFYGYCWGEEEPCDGNFLIGFDRLLERHEDRAGVDTFTDGSITYWYNGTATIERKSALGKRFGGVMIWDMGSDTDDGLLFSAVLRGLDSE